MLLFFRWQEYGGRTELISEDSASIAVQKQKHNHINNNEKLKGHTKADKFTKNICDIFFLKGTV
jgi:hypothetical protein